VLCRWAFPSRYGQEIFAFFSVSEGGGKGLCFCCVFSIEVPSLTGHVGQGAGTGSPALERTIRWLFGVDVDADAGR